MAYDRDFSYIALSRWCMFDAIYPWPAKYIERVMGRATSCNRLQRIVRDPQNLKRATSCNQLHRIIRDPRNLKSHELQPAATHHPLPAKFKEPELQPASTHHRHLSKYGWKRNGGAGDCAHFMFISKLYTFILHFYVLISSICAHT